MNVNKPLFFMLPFFGLIGISVFLHACKAQRVDTQGIVGQVYWIEGNQMPTFTTEEAEATDKPQKEKINRTLRIYKRTHISETTKQGPLFTKINTPLVAEITTEEDGSFIVGLSPGQYSIFTVEEDGLFASHYDQESYIQPFEVKEGEWTSLDILINYKAAY